jgi:DNA polymerase-3 subunit epsilon
MNFIALDLETANPCQSSICQIGIVFVVNSVVEDTWESLVDPREDFNYNNIAVHRIKPDDVKFAPTFPLLYEALAMKLNGNKVVHHTSFDRIALNKACDIYDLPRFDVEWVDSAKIVGKALPQFAKSGYGLKNVAIHFGYDFNHHNALEDAKAAAFVTIKCCELTGRPVSQIKY